MGFWSDVGQVALPAAGAIAGGAFGGPAGAMIGGSIGGGLSGMIGANEASKKQAEINAMNIALQREFAQHGIRWKVEDAKAAGIHPLVALGAQTHQFSANLQAGPTADLSGMGQDIGRAIASTGTAQDRQLTTLGIQGAALDVEGKALDNQIKQSQLRKMNAVGPAMPGATDSFIPGQGNSGAGIIDKPLERTKTLPGQPQSEPGAIPDMGWAKTATGLVPIPSSDVKQRIEDNMPHEWAHFLRNNVAPDTQPPRSALPRGAHSWKWNQLKMEWQPFFPEGRPAPRDPQRYKRMYKEGA